jgi:signal-transduction protein with cAMP-binding, CBS, and nucleotidyltransferase domain
VRALSELVRDSSVTELAEVTELVRDSSVTELSEVTELVRDSSVTELAEVTELVRDSSVTELRARSCQSSFVTALSQKLAEVIELVRLLSWLCES